MTERSWEVLTDPAAREELKKSQPGLRRDLASRPFIDLTPAEPGPELERAWRRRRTVRAFDPRPVTLAEVARLLACLRQERTAEETPSGEPKYLYASAGGLYPVQAYVHLRPGRIAGFAPGVYYYQPADHALVALTPGVDLDTGIHVPLVNQPVYEQAAFSLFLIAEMAAIQPMYGEWSRGFTHLEAGYMGQLLMMHAASCGLGLCPIGGLDFAAIRGHFALGETQGLVHSFLGGALSAERLQELAEDDGAAPASPLHADEIEREEGEL